MDKEKIILEKVYSTKMKDVLKDFKEDVIIKMYNEYSEEEIKSFTYSRMLNIKYKYVVDECKKHNISKYASDSIEFYKIKGYNDDEIKEIMHERHIPLLEVTPYRKEKYLKQGYTEEEADFLVKSKRNINKEYWISKGYTEEDAIKKVSNIQKENNKKYKEAIKANPEKYSAVSNTQKNYWLKKGFSEEEAEQKVKERQRTFTLEKCIEKYGIEKGTFVYKERQRKWRDKLQENFLKYGDGRNVQSKWAYDIITELCESIGIERPKKEKYITDKETQKHYSYDFCYKKKIIEFNGDYWHCNPEYWEYDSYNLSHKTIAANVWKDDEIKINCAKKYGYNVLVVWESDYYKNKNKFIEFCLNFLCNEN